MSQETDSLLQKGFRYALSLCHQTHDAEDLLHDAWVKLSAAEKEITVQLLYVCIRNLFIDKYRRDNLIEIDVDLQINDVPINELAQDLPVSEKSLQKALGRLRSSEREILFLHSVEEYTAAEIAELTCSSRGTILSSIFRSKKKLKKLLNMHYEQYLESASRG